MSTVRCDREIVEHWKEFREHNQVEARHIEQLVFAVANDMTAQGGKNRAQLMFGSSSYSELKRYITQYLQELGLKNDSPWQVARFVITVTFSTIGQEAHAH